MARGGARQGAGRKKGGQSTRTVALRAATRQAVIKIGKAIPDAFEGDGYAFMVAVYKDPRIDLDTRLHAAEKACRYERPTLQAIEHSGNPDKPVQQVTRIERVIIRPADQDS